MYKLTRRTLAAAAACVIAASTASAQVKELRVGYQPSPIQDASIAMFETWGAKNGVKIVKVPNSYGVYVEKMTASLTSNSDQYDVIWHNDDWGQLWAHLLEDLQFAPAELAVVGGSTATLSPLAHGTEGYSLMAFLKPG